MTSNKLKVLITRPESAGRVLAKSLADLDISSICQPMFDYQANASAEHVKQLLLLIQRPIVIFISAAAVEFAEKALPINAWFADTIISVGQATQKTLSAFNVESICPQQYNSEGILSLPELKDVKNKNVIIVRGNGGRELIAQTLKSRGANVHYIESYRRVSRVFSDNPLQQWREQLINCIVITSNDLLESIVQLLDDSDQYWLNTCLWVVASERIADHAKKLGLHHVVNANGANDEAITAVLVKYGTRS